MKKYSEAADREARRNRIRELKSQRSERLTRLQKEPIEKLERLLTDYQKTQFPIINEILDVWFDISDEFKDDDKMMDNFSLDKYLPREPMRLMHTLCICYDKSTNAQLGVNFGGFHGRSDLMFVFSVRADGNEYVDEYREESRNVEDIINFISEKVPPKTIELICTGIERYLNDPKHNPQDILDRITEDLEKIGEMD